jgi:cytochrome P450
MVYCETVRDVLSRLRVISMPNKIPGPPRWTYYPSYIYFMLHPIRDMRMRHKRYGVISGAPVETVDGAKSFVFAFGPEFNQQVLSNPAVFHSPTLPARSDTGASRLREGLLFLNGERHKQHRRLVMPSFHRKYIEIYHHDMVALTARMLDQWQPGNTRNIAHDVRQLTMSIANKTLFGLDDGAGGDNIGSLINEWLALNVSPFTRLFPFDRPGFPYRKLVRTSNALEQCIMAVIAHKRASTAESHDVLSTLLSARDEDGTRMTEAEVIGNTNVLFIAGHETSSNALTWTLLMLALHPKILADVVNELEGVLQREAPRAEHLSQLSLLDRVLKEALRMFPPLSWVQRNSVEPFEIGSYHMPAGVGVLLSHFITHRLPDLYAQPDQFKPERWEHIDPSPYEYIPFSAGPRMCIGAPFAMMEMKIVLSMLLTRYRLSLPDKAKINYRTLPTLSLHSLMMTVNKPDHRFSSSQVEGSILELIDLA